MAPNIVPTTFTARDEVSKKIEMMQSKASNFARTTADKFNAAGKSAFAFGRTTGIASAAILAPLGLAAKSAVDFEEKMSNVSTLIDTSKESIKGMGDEVLALSQKLPVPIDELTSSLYDIRSAGISAEDQMMALEYSAKLATTGLSTTQEATNLMTSALNAFKGQGLSAAQTSDILFKTVKAGKTTVAELVVGFGDLAPTAVAAKVSLEQVSAATAALTSTMGMKTAPAQTKLKSLFDEMTKSSGKLADAYKKNVGGSIAVATQSGDFMKVLEELKKSVGGNEVEFKNMFSSVEAGAAALALAGGANEAYTATLNNMKKGPEAIGEAFDKQSKTAKASMQIMKNNLQSLSITLGNALLPVINDLVSSIAPVIKSFSKWMQNNKPLVATIVKIAAGVGAFLAAVSVASFVIGGFQKALVLGKVAMAAFNLVMSLNPAGLLTAAIVGLGVAIYAVSKSFSGMTQAQRLNEEVTNRALENSVDQRVEMMGLFDTLRKAKQGTDEYTTALKRVEEMQPGITAKYDLQTKSVKNLALAEKDLTASIMKRATEEARAEIAKEKMKEAIRKSEGGSSTDTFTQSIMRATGGGDKAVDMMKKMEAKQLTKDAEFLLKQNEASKNATSPANPEAVKKDQKIELVINGESMGDVNSLNGKKISPSANLMPSSPKTR